MCDDSENPFLTIDETAELLRINRRTLDNLRWKGEGPPFRRHGGRIVYHRDEVLAWSAQRRARTAAQDENPPPNGHARSGRAPSDGSPTIPSDPPLERKPLRPTWSLLGRVAVADSRRARVIQLPEPHRSLADIRGYLPCRFLLTKPVVAREGNVVCRLGPLVTMQGRPVAHARSSDELGRPLPHWSGCSRLRADRLFVMCHHLDSFDSRYFGPVERRNIVGTALPLLAAAEE